MAGDDQTAMLREAAKARGFKLVKSRRRKAGGDFGKYGLKDEKGRECFGFGAKGLTADAEAVLAYLRGGETASWKRSLIGVVRTEEPASARALKEKKEPPPTPPRSRGGESDQAKPSRPDSPPAFAGGAGGGSSSPRPKTLTIRAATPKDAKALGKLLDAETGAINKRLTALAKTKTTPLVADRDGILGVIAWAIIPRLDNAPLARITILLVAEHARREGIGTALLAAAAKQFTKARIADVELLLDLSLGAPAGFLRKTGWTRSANAYRRDAR